MNVIIITICILLIFVVILLQFKKQPVRETFSEHCYSTKVIDEIIDTVNSNNDIIQSHSSFVNHFANNNYNSDQIDKIMSNERNDFDYYKTSTNNNIEYIKDQLPKFIDKEHVDKQYLLKKDMEYMLYPYVQRSGLEGQLESHKYDIDKLYYKAKVAEETLLNKSDIDKYYISSSKINSNIESVKEKLESLKDLLELYEIKTNVEGVYVTLSDFDKLKDQVNNYKQSIGNLQDIINSNELLFETTRKAINQRFDTFYNKMDDVKQQQEYIKKYIMNESDNITLSNDFAYKHDFNILQNDVQILESQLSNADKRLDKTEQKLIDMSTKLCVGDECFTYSDFVDAKSMLKMFKETYQYEKDLLETLQKEMIDDNKQIAELQAKLQGEINYRNILMEQNNNEIEEIRKKLLKDKEETVIYYDKIINRLEKEKFKYKEALDAFTKENGEKSNLRNKELEDLNKTIILLETNISDLEFDKKKTQQRLDELIVAYEDENGGYQKNMRERTKLINDLQAKVDNASTSLANTSIEMEKKIKEIEDIQIKLSSCNAERSKLKERNTNLTEDVSRLTELYNTLNSGNMEMQSLLNECNIDRLSRVTKEVHDVVQNDLDACNNDKRLNHLPKTAIDAMYVLKSEHSRYLTECITDKRENYTLNKIIKDSYVSKEEYDKMLKDMNNRDKYMTTDYVWNNYKSNEDYMVLQNQLVNDYVHVSRYNAEVSKTSQCDRDKKENYLPKTTVDTDYLLKTDHETLLRNADIKCEKEKQTQYKSILLYNNLNSQLQACNDNLELNYVPLKSYYDEKEKTKACIADKEQNTYQIEYVNNNYIPNSSHSLKIDLLKQEHNDDIRQNYKSNEYISQNYISNANHDTKMFEANQKCELQKVDIVSEFNKNIADNYYPKEYVTNNYVENETYNNVVNANIELQSKARELIKVQRELESYNAINDYNINVKSYLQPVPLKDIIARAKESKCGPANYTLSCPVTYTCNQYNTCVAN